MIRLAYQVCTDGYHMGLHKCLACRSSVKVCMGTVRSAVRNGPKRFLWEMVPFLAAFANVANWFRQGRVLSPVAVTCSSCFGSRASYRQTCFSSWMPYLFSKHFPPGLPFLLLLPVWCLLQILYLRLQMHVVVSAPFGPRLPHITPSAHPSSHP